MQVAWPTLSSDIGTEQDCAYEWITQVILTDRFIVVVYEPERLHGQNFVIVCICTCAPKYSE